MAKTNKKSKEEIAALVDSFLYNGPEHNQSLFLVEMDAILENLYELIEQARKNPKHYGKRVKRPVHADKEYDFSPGGARILKLIETAFFRRGVYYPKRPRR